MTVHQVNSPSQQQTFAKTQQQPSVSLPILEDPDFINKLEELSPSAVKIRISQNFPKASLAAACNESTRLELIVPKGSNEAAVAMLMNALKLVRGAFPNFNLNIGCLDEDLIKALVRVNCYKAYDEPPLLGQKQLSKDTELLAYFGSSLAVFPINQNATHVSNFRKLVKNWQIIPELSGLESCYAILSGYFRSWSQSENIRAQEKQKELETVSKLLDRLEDFRSNSADVKKVEKLLGIRGLDKILALAAWVKRFLTESTVEFSLGSNFGIKINPPKWGSKIIESAAFENPCTFAGRAETLLNSSLGSQGFTLLLSIATVLEYARRLGKATCASRSSDSYFEQEEERASFSHRNDSFAYDPVCCEDVFFNADEDLQTIESPHLHLKWNTIFNETLVRSMGIKLLPRDHDIPESILADLIQRQYLRPVGEFQGKHPLAISDLVSKDLLAWDLDRCHGSWRMGQHWCTSQGISDFLISNIPEAELAGIRAILKATFENSRVSGFGSFSLGGDIHIALLTAKNAAGKSTFLGAIKHAIHAHQSGRKVLANAAELSVVDRVFTDDASLESIGTGISRLQSQIVSMRIFLNEGTPRSVGIFDELFHGTSAPYQISLAWAVIEEIQTRNLYAVISTHIPELSCFGDPRGLELIRGIYAKGRDLVRQSKSPIAGYGVANYCIMPGFKMEVGAVLDSEAFTAAKKLGLPERVLDRASEIFDIVTQY